MKTEYHTDFLKTLEEDFGIMLLTSETVDTEIVEVMGGSHADGITYYSYPVTQVFADVSGFIFNHPYGATIRANFEQPVEVCAATYDEDGDELDFVNRSGALARAIMGKLGNIALGPDSELKAYAARA